MILINFLIFLKIHFIFANQCNDSCHKSSLVETGNCFCTNCTEFDDCCSNKKNYSQGYLKSDYECNARLNNILWIYTIGKCNSAIIDEELINKCNKDVLLLERIPVYSIQTGHFYKNIFCLICNSKKFDHNLVKIFEIRSPSHQQVTY